MSTAEKAAPAEDPKGFQPKPGTRRVEGEEPNFYQRTQHVSKNRRGLIQSIVVTRFIFNFGLFCMICGGLLGPAYVKHFYSPAFLEKLEKAVASKRQSFWQRRNQAQAYVTQKTTPWLEYLGFKTWDIRP